MELGRTERIYTVEPIKNPVPATVEREDDAPVPTAQKPTEPTKPRAARS